MLALVHAALLVALPAATALLCMRYGERPSLRRSVSALVISTLAVFLTILSSMHACFNGEPFTQWLIPGSCLLAALVLLCPLWLRISTALLLTVAMVGLSFSYSTAVHTDEYIGTMAPLPPDGAVVGHRAWHSWLTGLYLRER